MSATRCTGCMPGFSDSTTAKLCGVELKSFQKRCQRIRGKINDGRDFKQIIKGL
ncbi:MAG: hypothetical protein MJZ78_03710 [Bacteroidales bacterium]|nr:hypothetical protein [Bacteroidales bacterium]